MMVPELQNRQTLYNDLMQASNTTEAVTAAPRCGAGGVLAVAPVPLPDDHRGRPGGLGGSVPTRSRALASLLADPEARRGVGSAWPLYLALVLEWDGSASGTRDQIGERMGEDGRNVGNWISALEQAGIVTVVRTGRRVKVALTGAHMDAARMPDAVTVGKEAEPAGPAPDDGRRDVLDLMDRARALGGEAEVRIVVRAK